MPALESVRRLSRSVPGARRLIRAVVPSKRHVDAQWRRICRTVDVSTVQSGPFAGMQLVDTLTGSHIPKAIGCYECELHQLIEEWNGYDRILDVGCGEGWYVVGLARRMSAARVWGFDLSRRARRSCWRMAKENGIEDRVRVEGGINAAELAAHVEGRTLFIVDAEGAEVDVLDPQREPTLRHSDILVEMHDFIRPGATETIRQRFKGQRIVEFQQIPRDPALFPVLSTLSSDDQHRALDESRVPDQRWLWILGRPD